MIFLECVPIKNVPWVYPYAMAFLLMKNLHVRIFHWLPIEVSLLHVKFIVVGKQKPDLSVEF